MNPHQLPTSASAAAPESESLARISPAKQSANQANAQLSTGPKTSEGKAKSSLNAVKTGLSGRTVLLHNDDAAMYEQHVRDYEKELRPDRLKEQAFEYAWLMSQVGIKE